MNLEEEEDKEEEGATLTDNAPTVTGKLCSSNLTPTEVSRGLAAGCGGTL